MEESKARAGKISEGTVPSLIKDSVQRFGEKPALYRRIQEHWVGMSYAALDHAATCFAFGLMNRLGVQKGDHVALIANNRMEWMIADLGILYAAAVDVPRGSDTPAEILQTIVRHSDARIAILENAEQLEKLRPLLGELDQLIFIDPPASTEAIQIRWCSLADCLAEGERDFAQAEEQVGQRLAQLHPDDLATIIYTSGTTGNPKGVMIAHRNYMHNVETVPVILGNTSKDKSLSFLPIWHAFERMIEYIILSVGASVYYSNISELREHLPEVQPTLLITVPDFWVTIYKAFLRKAMTGSRFKKLFVSLILRSALRYQRSIRLLRGDDPRFTSADRPSNWRKAIAWLNRCVCAPAFFLADRLLFKKLRATLGNHLELVSSGAGPLPEKVDDFMNAAGINVVEGYGLTETMVIIAVRDAKHKRFQTVGGVLPGLEIQIRSESGVPLGPGQLGSVYFRGPTLMLGYYKNPELTSSLIDRDGWFDTGDLGMWTIDGCLKILGRADDMLVLTNGEKVNAVILENELRSESLVERAVVVGQGKPYAAAFLFPNPQELRALAQRKGVSYQQLEELAENPQILAEYKALCDRVSLNRDRFTAHERIRRFQLVFWRLEVGKELSQSLKLRRLQFTRLHQKEIDGLFKAG